jgi:large subunit ribosomal protein L18
MAFNKALRRQKIRWKIRKRLEGTTERPRISIFRSNKYIYAQLIDDIKGVTLTSASSKKVATQDMSKTAQAAAVGKKLAEQALALGVSAVLFDRSGYLYHGRVKALADGAREGGLKF